MSVRRFVISNIGDEIDYPDGHYVTFTDHERAVAEARRSAFREAAVKAGDILDKMASEIAPPSSEEYFELEKWLLARAAEGEGE